MDERKMWLRTLRRLHRRLRRAAGCYCQEHCDEANWLMRNIVWIENNKLPKEEA